MKNRLALVIVVAIALALCTPAAVWGGPAMTDLEQQVYSELLRLPFYSVFDNIQFRVEGTRVILTGEVTRPSVKRAAQGALKRLSFVEQIQNDLEILPFSKNDDRIRSQVFQAIYSSGSFLRHGTVHAPVRIIVRNGDVRLVGAVATELEKNLAYHRAASVDGVFSVTNDLVL